MEDKEAYLFYWSEGESRWFLVEKPFESLPELDDYEDKEEFTMKFKFIHLTKSEYKELEEC